MQNIFHYFSKLSSSKGINIVYGGEQTIISVSLFAMNIQFLRLNLTKEKTKRERKLQRGTENSKSTQLCRDDAALCSVGDLYQRWPLEIMMLYYLFRPLKNTVTYFLVFPG